MGVPQYLCLEISQSLSLELVRWPPTFCSRAFRVMESKACSLVRPENYREKRSGFLQSRAHGAATVQQSVGGQDGQGARPPGVTIFIHLLISQHCLINRLKQRPRLSSCSRMDWMLLRRRVGCVFLLGETRDESTGVEGVRKVGEAE
ncbi:hypothetical protein EYF80_052631 [Liparis tanakae]|uniref:Uncharacterized protein n=1 Tax=Liparis tanakae TaxID=230148 RepID=A0A4Z2F7T3_9TELE|nr:hypothetical protein EYF80_052631 [Liparis tanakae]